MPSGVVTETETIPDEPGGAFAVMRVALSTVNPAASAVPNLTDVAAVNPLPEMSTWVPPATGPCCVDKPVMDGTPA